MILNRKRSNSIILNDNSNENYWIGNNPQRESMLKQQLINKLKQNFKVPNSKTPDL